MPNSIERVERKKLVSDPIGGAQSAQFKKEDTGMKRTGDTERKGGGCRSITDLQSQLASNRRGRGSDKRSWSIAGKIGGRCRTAGTEIPLCWEER
jgi:hypothetical protein